MSQKHQELTFFMNMSLCTPWVRIPSAAKVSKFREMHQKLLKFQSLANNTQKYKESGTRYKRHSVIATSAGPSHRIGFLLYI